MATTLSKKRGRSSRALSWTMLVSFLALSTAFTQPVRAQGLLGQYYSWDPSLPCAPDRAQVFTTANLDFTRIDPTVDFGNPFVLPNTTPHNFAARWTGFIMVPTTGDYQFTTRSDDGIRLWISKDPAVAIDPNNPGKADIDFWIPRGEGGDDPPVTVHMVAGSEYPVQIEFCECGGGNAARFRYIAPGASASTIVPSSLLVPPAAGTTSPGAISDLAATPTFNAATLTFTAPGSNGATGTAAGYEVRYSTTAITAANFHSATLLGTPVKPMAAGGKESITVPGLDSLQGYYFAVEAVDAAGNEGALSNVAQTQTTGAPGFPTLPAITDKVVYYDPAYATNWIDRPATKQINDYFVSKGYTSVNAAGLAAFMTAHATSKVPSAVVMSNDIYPDTVIDITQKTIGNKNILNSYLNNGGRIVQYGDWPFYNIALTKPAGAELSPNPGGNGGPEILGFDVASGNQTATTTMVTPVGAALGLKSTWSSQRPTAPSKVDVVLGSTVNGAAGWIKFYPGPTGPGFFGRLYDTTSSGQAGDLLTADQLADGQTLAEVHGVINFQLGRVIGTVVDGSGNPIAGVPITLKGALGSTVTATSDANGNLSSPVAGDTYTVTGGDTVSFLYNGLPAAPVVVPGGKVTTIPTITAAVPPFYETSTPALQSDDFAGTTLDPKWTDLDIGDAQSGSAAPNKGELDAVAGGSDIWNNADGFHYTFQPGPIGNFAATVEVLGIPDVNDWTKGGVMLRKTTDPASAEAFTGFTPRHDGQNEVRPTQAAATSGNSMTGFMAAGLPTWIKVRRVDNKVASYWTKDPTKGPVNYGGIVQVDDFGGLASLLVGIAETSHNASDIDNGFTYAHFRVESLGGTTVTPGLKLGDPLGKGKITLADATAVLEYAVLLKFPTVAQAVASDVNKDGIVNVKDVTLILQAIVNGTTF